MCKRFSCALLLFFFIAGLANAQFTDDFDDDTINGWFWFTGDGNTTMDFIQHKDFARIEVDATQDTHNVWWAIIKRNVASHVDLDKLTNQNFELRVEARVRLSHAPRRINFMINTQRTTNFHKQLREYDIADTTGWHTISMTTNELDAKPGDSLYVQLGVTDWGRDNYHVDLDYYKAYIVDTRSASPDKGEPLVYHPPVPETVTFDHHRTASQDAIINPRFPKVNFNNWYTVDQQDTVQILTVSNNQWPILRWDFSNLKNATAEGAGLLELTTQSVARGGDYIKHFGQDLGMEFGNVRVIEIMAGDPDWNQQKVTYASLVQGQNVDEVINGQMIFDFEPATQPNSKNYITISRPVLQRLLNGTTKGLILKPLGALEASFFSTEYDSTTFNPKLHFTTTGK